MNYRITCESSADLGQEVYKKNKIGVVPFTITLGDQDFKDGVDIKNDDMFKFFDETKTLPKTSAINEFEYEEFFTNQLKDCDGLIHISISSKASSTYNNAVNASKKFKNVHVIDSLSLSSGIGIQVLYACSLRDKGVPIDEAVELITKRRENVRLSFVIDKLTYLHKGGRCSALSLLGANMLSIKPSIKIDNGKMVIGKKYVGKLNKILDKFICDTLNEYSTPDKDMCYITYSTATDEMLKITHETLDKLNVFKHIEEKHAGSTITTHCGPNTLGIIYYNDGDRIKEFKK